MVETIKEERPDEVNAKSLTRSRSLILYPHACKLVEWSPLVISAAEMTY